MSAQTTRFICRQKSAFGSGSPILILSLRQGGFRAALFLCVKNMRNPMVCAVHTGLETITKVK